MSTFEERERAFENMYQHDQELVFRINVRRAKLLGRWVAEQIGLNAEDAEAYVKELVHDDFDHHDTGHLLNRVRSDLAARGVDISAHRVEKEAEHLLKLAHTQVTTE